MWDISVVESDAKESGHDLFVFFLSLQLAPNSIQHHDGSTTCIDQPLHRNPSTWQRENHLFLFSYMRTKKIINIFLTPDTKGEDFNQHICPRLEFYILSCGLDKLWK